MCVCNCYVVKSQDYIFEMVEVCVNNRQNSGMSSLPDNLHCSQNVVLSLCDDHSAPSRINHEEEKAGIRPAFDYQGALALRLSPIMIQFANSIGLVIGPKGRRGIIRQMCLPDRRG